MTFVGYAPAVDLAGQVFLEPPGSALNALTFPHPLRALPIVALTAARLRRRLLVIAMIRQRASAAGTLATTGALVPLQHLSGSTQQGCRTAS
jgi:hypothetical protein